MVVDNMSEETQTPKTDGLDPSEGNPFVTEAGASARRINAYNSDPIYSESHIGQFENKKTQKQLLGAGLAGAALAAGAIAITPHAVEAIDGIDYPHDTMTYTVQPGDGWYDVIDAIPGIDSVDKREVIDHIKTDPANISILQRGELQPGQTIVIPINVAP